MADVQFTVTDRRAPREVCRPGIRRIADRIRAETAAATPYRTGTLRGGWKTEQGRDPATSFVTNAVRYGRYVEFGTRRRPARAMLGRTVARYR